MIDISKLPWLKTPPDNFKELCQEIYDTNNEEKLFELSKYYLNESKLNLLGKTLIKFEKRREISKISSVIKIIILSNSNIDLLKIPLIATALRYQIKLKIITCSLDQGPQKILDPNSEETKLNPDLIVLNYDHRYFFKSSTEAIDNSENSLTNSIYKLSEIISILKKNKNTTIGICNLAIPCKRAFGSLDTRLRGSLFNNISEINNFILKNLDTDDLFIDIDYLASNLGKINWFDERLWHYGKIPFAPKYIPIYCDYIMRTIASFSGLTKKCLVIDFDNTIWGGVLGDDGIEGVIIGNGSAEGEAYLDFQKYILKLHSRGILIAACSKNNKDTALEMLEKHPENLLKPHHFSSFYCNWNDKPSNIKSISEDLNIGLDSIVFFDDNVFEREFARKSLPDINVIEVSNNPEEYISLIENSGLFEATIFSEEDKLRNKIYRENKKRISLSKNPNVNDYLKSLNMELNVEFINSLNKKRVVQLINKTNQFNLTTKRYSEAEIETFENSENNFGLSFRLKDTFGDNGIISIILCRKLDSNTNYIDTWLMSCRVFNRQIENAVLDTLVELSLLKKINLLKGEYIKTSKNILVSDLYEKLGFYKINSKDRNLFSLELNKYKKINQIIKVNLPDNS